MIVWFERREITTKIERTWVTRCVIKCKKLEANEMRSK
jgi:hypothetical protein